MKHYSAVLFRRIGWTFLWLFLLTCLTAWWFLLSDISVIQAEKNKQASVYRPQRLIDLTLQLEQTLSEALRSPAITTLDMLPSSDLGCDDRGRSVLRNRAVMALGVSAERAEHLLSLLENQAATRLSCVAWGELLSRLYSRESNQSGDFDGQSGRDPSLFMALSENVSWNIELPCLFASTHTGMRLLLGTPNRCPQAEVSNLELASANPKGSTLAMAAATSRALLLNADRGLVLSLKGSPQWLTLHPGIQDKLDAWKACLMHDQCKLLPNARQLRHLSIVITDVNTGDILGVLCWGPPCTSPAFRKWENLAALMIEVPPASTIKLIHALALAAEPEMDLSMLRRQIKSSGQSEGVSKRNEWWEKQAVCDLTARQRSCDHLMHFARLAQELGFNQNCVGRSMQCGRQSLIANTTDLSLPGFLGHTTLGLAERQAVPMIEWSTYNAIRNQQLKPDKSQAYMNTSNAVQSVIGAGNTRSSPLGLAHVTAQIMRMATNFGPTQAHLIRPMHFTPSGEKPKAREANAAKVVLQGMQMVMRPVESGWKDPGTMAGHFQKQFGVQCVENCGVWGKTGTVSVRDPNFSGGSLFAGVIQTKRLGDSLGLQGVPDATLSIGLVAIAAKGQLPFHDAGAASIALIAELLRDKP